MTSLKGSGEIVSTKFFLNIKLVDAWLSSIVISIVSSAVFSLPSSAVNLTVYIPSEVKND